MCMRMPVHPVARPCSPGVYTRMPGASDVTDAARCARMSVEKKMCADAVLLYASACQRIQRWRDAVLVYAARMPGHPAQRGRSPGVCTRMPVRPVLKSAQMRSWRMLAHASASSGAGMQSWCMQRACQCIQRSGGVVLVYAAHTVRPVFKQRKLKKN